MRKYRNILSQQSQKQLAVDISPLLDVVFILLIFFIVSAVFVKETGVNIERPQAISATQAAQSSVLIALTETGEVWYGGAQIGLAGVAPLIRQMPNKPIVIQADKRAETGLLVALIDACKLATKSSVSIATKKG
ncbi:ExbD/TolR family protein [Shewanella intestini]|uniref:Biopolymer transporter ExbD n=1 Tax=Shewanella intestini TaxID=2017544 RepID=A0ABS5I043_9GAMM|nr:MULTISPECIES: biopolymer transporter ExbD [Shewanella]MBR9727395.1 biopolymer transporter ExbD [Shewanella intestini]MRG35555.1 biopolymer transporter ExbD [Shewanella sp. XMDDZSB0408]